MKYNPNTTPIDHMADVAAAVDLGQFAKLDSITAQRRKLAKHYFATLGRISKNRPAHNCRLRI